MLDKINYLIFTLFNIGKLPIPGTVASAFTTIFYFFLIKYLTSIVILIILIVITIYSLLFLKKTLNNFENKDPKEIVIDEFIGQLIPLLICNGNIYLICISFVCFRIFDIFKIFPSNIFDKKISGSIGIIGDDIVAGLYTMFIIYLIKTSI